MCPSVKENIQREAKEAAHRRRLKELEEQKRHSWSGGEEVGTRMDDSDRKCSEVMSVLLS